MSRAPSPTEGVPSQPVRVRAALRRHGLVRRPRPLRRFLRRHGLRFTEGNRVQVYATGDAGLAAMLAAIERAERRIHLETYILRADEIGSRFLAALTAKARAGVTVRVLYDGFGSFRLDRRALAPLVAAGGEVVVFNPIRRFYPRWLPRRRDHRKILVVDGAIAFTGGLNIGDEYNAGAAGPAGAWRDTHVQVDGPAARELEAVFLESWFRADGPNLPWGDLLDRAVPARGPDRVAVIPDGPAYRRRVIRDLILLALGTAEARVRLTSPYFAPDRRVLGALRRAHRRGVQVSLLLAGRTDHPVLRRATRALLPGLLAEGILVYEHYGVFVHAKSSVIDDAWAIAGTSNLDRQSFEHSYEVNLLFEGCHVPARLAAQFDADVLDALAIDAARLAGRGALERVIDRLCAVALWIV